MSYPGYDWQDPLEDKPAEETTCPVHTFNRFVMNGVCWYCNQENPTEEQDIFYQNGWK